MSYPAGSLGPMKAAEIQHTAALAATTPFALRASLRAMNSFAPCAGDQLVGADHVRKAFIWPGAEDHAVVVDVRERTDGEPGVLLRVYAEAPLTPGQTSQVEMAVRH